MVQKRITYTDYAGVERTETFYFNISKSELIRMESTTEGGYAQKLQRIIDAKDGSTIMELFEDIVLLSYGERTDDGRGFIKVRNGMKLAEEFAQTAAYDELYYELCTDAEAASAFVTGIIPKNLVEEANKIAATGQVDNVLTIDANKIASTGQVDNELTIDTEK